MISLLFIVLFATSAISSDDCFCKCDVVVKVDTITFHGDSAFVTLKVVNHEDDTLLLKKYGHFDYEWLEFSAIRGGYIVGGTATMVKKNLCDHWNPALKKRAKAQLKWYQWMKVAPHDSVLHTSLMGVMEKHTKLNKVIPYASFIYKYNQELENYQVCPRKPVKEEFRWKRKRMPVPPKPKTPE